MFVGFVHAEEITMTTYYPVPFGTYKEMRLFPNNTPSPCAAVDDAGKLYYDNTDNQVRACSFNTVTSTYEWQTFEGLWDVSGNDIYPSDANWTIGVGTATPDSSVVLDLSSTVAGFLPPRMTTAQRDSIAAPAEGLFVYNTADQEYQFFNGALWKGASLEPATECYWSGTPYSNPTKCFTKLGTIYTLWTCLRDGTWVGDGGCVGSPCEAGWDWCP